MGEYFETAEGSFYTRLQRAAYPWPKNAPRPPANADEALSSDGQWSVQACGVRIGHCRGTEAHKGRGAFAARSLERGSVVGVYWGEFLSAREYRQREEGGVQSAYTVGLIYYDCADLQQEVESVWPDHAMYIDASNEDVSSWCRFINHAPSGTPACNLVLRTDGMASRAWFESVRDIAPGEELQFDYGPRYATQLGY